MAVAVWGGPGNVMYIDETIWHYKCAKEGSWAALFKGDMPRQLPSGAEARAHISESCMEVDYGAGEGNFKKMLAYLNHSNTGEEGYRLLAEATKQVWQLSDDMSSRAVRQWAHYDQLRKPIAGVHIRAGDKWNEDKDNAGWHNRVQWIDNFRSLAARNSIDDVKSCLLMGDSWPAKWNATRLMQSEGMTPSLHVAAAQPCSMPRPVRVSVPALRASAFDNVELAPADPILGVSEAFRACTHPNKLNLGVGAYRNEELKPMVLNVVRKAEKKILSAGDNKEYLPIEGLDAFRKATIDLLLGEDEPAIAEGRVAVVQALSGTGSLRVAAAFIGNWLKGRTVYLSNPTWGNHRNIFADEGVEWKYYRYFDPATVGLDFKGLMEDITAAPDGSIILLHGCAHNPTGVDPTPEQWGQIADLCIKKSHLPFFDVAYQGFATGYLDKDAFAPRLFLSKGLEIMTAQSYSKNLGRRVISQNPCLLPPLTRGAQPLFSAAPTEQNTPRPGTPPPPPHPEMLGMAGRIKRVRGELQEALTHKSGDRDWGFITRQIGMFSFTGLTPTQVDNMTAKHHVYMTRDGRISLAGLNSAKVEYLADAMVESVRAH
ncbi:MAG: hypothetical protein WDW38_011465 [Sanguina aurantia]